MYFHPAAQTPSAHLNKARRARAAAALRARCSAQKLSTCSDATHGAPDVKLPLHTNGVVKFHAK